LDILDDRVLPVGLVRCDGIGDGGVGDEPVVAPVVNSSSGLRAA
jgi:hypothetical protein